MAQTRHPAPQALAKPPAEQAPEQIIVAVIDTGIDWSHPALRDFVWLNSGETGDGKETNGLDDDGNGYIDDTHGWNFADNNSNVFDDHGHGTHISGIIAQDARIRIMPLKYFSRKPQKTSTVKATTAAIHYAVAMGAKVINYSSGGYRPDRNELAALQSAQQAGVLVVAAAGNHGRNTDHWRYFPADYPLNNIISVGAADEKNRLLPFSNYGDETVDLIGPGKNIFSTLPGKSFGYMSGSSQATAAVSRLIARHMLENPRQHIQKPALANLIAQGLHAPQLAGKTRYQVSLAESRFQRQITGKEWVPRDTNSMDHLKKKKPCERLKMSIWEV